MAVRAAAAQTAVRTAATVTSSAGHSHDLGLSARGSVPLPGLVDPSRLHSAMRIDGSARERRGEPVITAIRSDSKQPEAGGERQTAAAAGAAGAPSGDGYCCPCLKACFDKVWAAVKWFFNMIADWFMSLCCPKSGAQLLKDNKTLADLLHPEEVRLEIDHEAVRAAFKTFSPKEQLRIADEAYKNFSKGNVASPVITPEEALAWLLNESRPGLLPTALRRLLDSAAAPSSPLAVPQPPVGRGNVQPDPVRARVLIRGNESLMGLINDRSNGSDFCHNGMLGIFRGMKDEERLAIAMAVCTHFSGRNDVAPEEAYAMLVNNSWQTIVNTLRMFLNNEKAGIQAERTASAATAIAVPAAASLNPKVVAGQLLLRGNAELLKLLKAEEPTKEALTAALGKMSPADQRTIALAACIARYGIEASSASGEDYYLNHLTSSNQSQDFMLSCLVALRDYGTPAAAVSSAGRDNKSSAAGRSAASDLIAAVGVPLASATTVSKPAAAVAGPDIARAKALLAGSQWLTDMTADSRSGSLPNKDYLIEALEMMSVKDQETLAFAAITHYNITIKGRSQSASTAAEALAYLKSGTNEYIYMVLNHLQKAKVPSSAASATTAAASSSTAVAAASAQAASDPRALIRRNVQLMALLGPKATGVTKEALNTAFGTMTHGDRVAIAEAIHIHYFGSEHAAAAQNDELLRFITKHYADPKKIVQMYNSYLSGELGPTLPQ